MPSKNVVKTYVSDGFYHAYNRGVEKRTIFNDTQDYKVFLGYLKDSLSEPSKRQRLRKAFTLKGETFKGVSRQPKNFLKEIELIAYCLISNHFHLLLKQNKKKSMAQFLQSISTRYSMYFNKKYDRVGSLFQGPYKAILITKDPYLLHLSRYIHINPLENTMDLTKAYSSYADYLGLRKTLWVKPDIVLSFFSKATLPEFKKGNSYKDFVEKYQRDSRKILGELTLENL